MRRFYAPIENFREKSVTLDSVETHHLRDVLRLQLGEEVSVFDGAGREFQCKIIEIKKKISELAIVAEIPPASPESGCEITLAATVLNGEKFDLVIQKAVELGAAALIPLKTLRCDIQLKDAEKRLDRWCRISLEATKQSGRANLMRIANPQTLESLIANSKGENMILFSERDGEDFSCVTEDKKITALFGPKGGWDDSELEAARSSGVKIVTLGGRTLRAETAAITITAILQHRFGDLK